MTSSRGNLLAQILPQRREALDDAASATDEVAETIETTDPEMPHSVGDVTAIMEDTLEDALHGFFERLPYLIVGLLILLITWVVAWIAVKIARRVFKKADARESLKELIARGIKVIIWIVGFMIALMVMVPGLTVARALGALGLVSIAVGLAFRDIFENFFAGILLLWRFPFENGDFITCEGITGEVESVEVRNTRIRKTTGELVVLPNATLFKNEVDILTNRDTRRVTIIAGVAYGENLDGSVQVIERAVKQCSTVNRDEPVQIFPQGFGDSSMEIEVTWWTGSRPVEIRRSRGEVVAAVKRALDEAGIEIPFPYRTLVFKEPLQTASLNGGTERSHGNSSAPRRNRVAKTGDDG